MSGMTDNGMIVCVISDASRNLIAAHTASGRRRSDGSSRAVEDGWEVEFDLEVYNRLKELDDDLDRAIARLCSKQFGNA